jgi:hypothetical protein
MPELNYFARPRPTPIRSYPRLALSILSDGVVDPTTPPVNTGVTNYYLNTVGVKRWVWPANGTSWIQV